MFSLGSISNRMPYAFAGSLGLFRAAEAIASRRLRILTYHGLCEDSLRNEPWLPRTFVTRSQFTAHMKWLAERYHTVSLGDALRAMAQEKPLPDRSVAVTFDDGYDTTFSIAGPVLKRFGIPATAYLSTAYIGSRELFPFDRLHLVRSCRNAPGEPLPVPAHKTLPIHCVLCWLSRHWPTVEPGVSSAQRSTLQPASWETVRTWAGECFEIGAHTVSHAILGNEIESVRVREIAESISRVRDEFPNPGMSFSYPNGRAGDFNAKDMDLVRSNGCAGAVSTQRGFNGAGSNLYALKRMGVGIDHDVGSVQAELAGFRTISDRFYRLRSRLRGRRPIDPEECPFEFIFSPVSESAPESTSKFD